VARAIAKNRAKGLPTDYLSLNMPEETRYYVPKLQAIKNIIAQPEVYGLVLPSMPNRPYFGTVDKPGDMDVTLAAKLAEIPMDEFIALNPAYQRPVIPGSSKSPLVLPADKIQIFRDNLNIHEAQDKPLSAWKTYTLKKGEKLDAIAARYDVSTARLKQLNSIGPRTKVGPGFTLLVPGKDAPHDSQLAALDAKLPDAPSESSSSAHCKTVKKGKKKVTVCSAPKGKTTNSKSSAKEKTGAKGAGKTSGKNSAKSAAKSNGKAKSPAKAAPAKKHKH
jgi:membrane-bound lytic murein transglycosylase D